MRIASLFQSAKWVAFAMLFTPVLAAAQEQTTQPPVPPSATLGTGQARAGSHAVEVVFVLDTTGSMSGLIHAAKEKVWAIANTLASAKPTPEIRMGLVGYRDRADEYVTKVSPLSDELDAVYKDLMQYQAGGGGDGPESVNQALHEAVSKIDWSDDETTYRVIFLVGDAPPHMDYPDDVKYPQTCERAAQAGISINTIQCGGQRKTTPFWTKIAQLAEGKYFRVDQSGSAVLDATPFDEKLAELSSQLDGTRVFFGSENKRADAKKNAETAKEVAAGATAAARARRAEFRGKAGLKDAAAEADLVEAVINGKVDAGNVERDQLPQSLRNLSAGDLKDHIDQLAKQRQALQQKINELAQQRQRYVKEQVAKQTREGNSLDAAIFECIKQQGAQAGLTYSGGPSY